MGRRGMPRDLGQELMEPARARAGLGPAEDNPGETAPESFYSSALLLGPLGVRSKSQVQRAPPANRYPFYPRGTWDAGG